MRFNTVGVYHSHCIFVLHVYCLFVYNEGSHLLFLTPKCTHKHGIDDYKNDVSEKCTFCLSLEG